MVNRIVILTIVLSSVFSYGSAQERDSLVFTKGRGLTSLFGSLTNRQVDIGSGGSTSTVGYRVGTKSGVFIKDNLVLGLNFAISKSDFENNGLSIDAEDLLIGLWSRLYFSHKGQTALYFEVSPYYSSIFRQNTVLDSGGGIIADEEVTGNGFGVLPGLGFTYILNRNIGFGITLSYSFTRLNVDNRDLILNQTILDTYNVNELHFNFNFQVYLNQFFF